MPNVKQDQDGQGQANGQPGDVDARVQAVAAKIPVGDPKMVDKGFHVLIELRCLDESAAEGMNDFTLFPKFNNCCLEDCILAFSPITF
jgi:hypothetical protein